MITAQLTNLGNKFNTKRIFEGTTIPSVVTRPIKITQVNSLEMIGFIDNKENIMEISRNQSIELGIRQIPAKAKKLLFLGTRRLSREYTRREVSSYSKYGRARYSNVKKYDYYTETILYSIEITDKIRMKYRSHIGVEFQAKKQTSKIKKKQGKQYTKDMLVKEISKFTELYLNFKESKVKRVNPTTIKLLKEENEYQLSSNVENTSDKIRYFGLGMKIFDFILSDTILTSFVEFGKLKIYKSELEKYLAKFSNEIKIDTSEIPILIVEYLVRSTTLTTASDKFVSFYYIKDSPISELDVSNVSIAKFFDHKDAEEQLEISDKKIIQIEKVIKEKIAAKFDNDDIDPILRQEMEEELYQLDDWYNDLINGLRKNKRMDEENVKSQIDELTQDYNHYKNEIDRRYLSSFDIIPNMVFSGKATSIILNSSYNELAIAALPKGRSKFACTNCGNNTNLVFDDKSLELFCLNCSNICPINSEIYEVTPQDKCIKCNKEQCNNHELKHCIGGLHIQEKYCSSHVNSCFECELKFCTSHLKSCSICKKRFCTSNSYYFTLTEYNLISTMEIKFEDRDSLFITINNVDENNNSPDQVIFPILDEEVESINPINIFGTGRNTGIKIILQFRDELNYQPNFIEITTNDSKNEIELIPLKDIFKTIERDSQGKKLRSSFACEKDSFFCLNHNEFHNSNTNQSLCVLGGEIICAGSIKSCEKCDKQFLCEYHASETLTKCSECNNFFCGNHSTVICSSEHKKAYHICQDDIKVCKVCEKQFCSSHVVQCAYDHNEYICHEDEVVVIPPGKDSRSKKVVCSEHSYYCQNHETFHLIDVQQTKCVLGGEIICAGSIKSCEKCDKQFLCENHASETLTKCSECNNFFCGNHSTVICSSEHKKAYHICQDDIKVCKVCVKQFCSSHVVQCVYDHNEYICHEDEVIVIPPGKDLRSKRITCPEHSYYCPNHETFHLIDVQQTKCDFDNKVICNNSISKCKNCQKTICFAHTIVCGKCSKPLCTEEEVSVCVTHPINPHCFIHSFTDITSYGTSCLPQNYCVSCNLPFITRSKVMRNRSEILDKIPKNSILRNMGNECNYCIRFTDPYETKEVKVKGDEILQKSQMLSKKGIKKWTNTDLINNYLKKSGNGRYLIIDDGITIAIRKLKFLKRFETVIFMVNESGVVSSQYMSITGFGSQSMRYIEDDR